MKSVVILIAVCLALLSGCVTAKGPTTVAGVPVDPAVHAEAKELWRSWFLKADKFTAHLDRVKVGWTAEQLLLHAGTPDWGSRDGNWTYKCTEGWSQPVTTPAFTFIIVEGRVAKIERWSMGPRKQKEDEDRTTKPSTATE